MTSTTVVMGPRMQPMMVQMGVRNDEAVDSFGLDDTLIDG